jgi:K(+)-stimulated pyrophosphate-energized sodium pump
VKVAAFVLFLAVALVFVWRSFYAMRIKTGAKEAEESAPAAAAHG